MLHQRKRFSYLSTQQRTLNSSDGERSFMVNKVGSIVSSNTKSHQHKIQGDVTQQFNNSSRKPSLGKNLEFNLESKPVLKNMTYNKGIVDHFSNINKQNLTGSTKQYLKSAHKSVKAPTSTSSSVTIPIQSMSLSPSGQLISQLRLKVKELQQQNGLLLNSTQEKFIQLQSHLQKVQNILKEKEQLIQTLTHQNKKIIIKHEKVTQDNQKFLSQNQRYQQQNHLFQQQNQNLIQQNKLFTHQSSQSSQEDNPLIKQNQQLRLQKEVKQNQQLRLQKEELLKIIAEKNMQINSFNKEKQESLKISQALAKQKQEKFFSFESSDRLKCVEEIETQTDLNQVPVKSYFLKQKLTAVNQAQTQLQSSVIEQLLKMSLTSQQNSKSLNYRQKYESLFKKALSMQDEMYKLKEELFDNQSQMKTLQQEFNTYKIFNQIEKLNQRHQ